MPSREPLHLPVDRLRPAAKRVTIHPLEKFIAGVVSLHLAFLPWALGTMHPWAQWTSLGLAALAFLAAIIPRHYREEHTGGVPFRLVPHRRLVRFPIFWIGLLVLAVIVVQALNPAWSYRSDGKVIWMQMVSHNEWLPRGTRAPFERWNQWRMLVIYASGLLTVCTIWIAFTRQRTVRYCLFTLAFNGIVLALFGIAERLLGNGKIYWVLEYPGAGPYATFIYKNHAGAYLDLALAVVSGFAGWYYLRGIRRFEKSNPSGVLAFFATCIAVSILNSYARGATLVMVGFLIIAVAAFIIHQVRLPRESRKPVVALALIIVFGYSLKTGLESMQSREAWDRLRQGVMGQDFSLPYRQKVTRASLDMLSDTWMTGTGAGSYRYLFPVYQHRDHDLVVGVDGRRLFWEHAHNDLVQFPIELGIAGASLLAAGLLYWLTVVVRSKFWRTPLSACIVSGLLLLLVYAWWDFPFQNPAVLITWCALWPLSVLWARFEEASPRI